MGTANPKTGEPRVTRGSSPGRTFLSHVLLLVLVVLGSSGCGAQGINRAPQLDPGGDMARFALSENTPVGSFVYTLKGSDPEGSRLRYSISGPQLTVDPTSGVVVLVRPLDRETEDILEVVVSVTDQPVGGSEANTVSVRREVAILDANDNPPIFHNRPYSLAIPETTEVGKIITLPGTISITDADGGVNADITLSCSPDAQDPEACETFDVWAEKVLEGQFTGVLRLRAPLDFERRRGYSLSLIASDGARNPRDRLNSTSRVAIEILDVQDQPPMFLDEPFSASVSEGSPEGTSVLTVRARDGDHGNPRPVKLSLSNDHKGYFRLEPVPQNADSEGSERLTSTAILVTNNTMLDREDPDIVQSGGIYTFQVVAAEMDGDDATDSKTVSTVTIVVRDVDDKLPAFNGPAFRVQLSEDAARDSTLPSLLLNAADADASVENARFILRLSNVPDGGDAASIFTVHPTGPVSGRTPVVVRVSDPSKLDYDSPNSRKEFVFDVEAIPLVNGSDHPAEGAVPADRSRVTVSLVDANDNAPHFNTESMKLKVKEDAPPGTMISDISATDADSGAFGNISYSLGGFGSERFWTHPVGGGLFVGECGGRFATLTSSSNPVCFDFESQMWYSLTLSAEDGGGRVSTVNLLVELEDVNDNAPVFEKKEYRRTVREGATSFDPQLFVKATDRDGPSQGGGEVRYEILGGTGGPLSVDPDTGEVRLTRPALSSETPGSRGEFEAIVRATDKGNPPLYADTRLFIRVGVAGNQRPMFKGVSVKQESAILQATVKENAPPGTHVITLSATDPDGADSQLMYAIAGGARDNFVVDRASGEVTVAREANLRLERLENGGVAGLPEYGVIVTAIDSGTPARETGTATLVIKVEDVNDQPPRFPPASTTESYVRQVSERAAPGAFLIRLHADDPDSDALLKYSLVQPKSATDHAGLPSVSSKAFDLDTAFRINSTTGELFVAGPLSHQAAAVITLTVEARDVNAMEQVEKQIDRVEVTIYVEAYSDDLPVFSVVSLTPGVSGSALVGEQRNQVANETGDANKNGTTATIQVFVPEEREVGSLLLQIGAYDPILSQPVNILEKVSSSDPEDYVSVSSPSGQIKLNRPIDYEQMEEKVIKLRVRAIADDGVRSSEALVLINIEDINDNNPEFSQEVYKAHIPESARYPEQVVTVSAMDKDSVSTWGTVTYSVSGDGANLFTVDNTTGVIRVAKGATLDHETKPQVDLLVTATDSGQKNSQSVRGLQRKATAIVTIEIMDVNDNPPQFVGGTHPLSESLSHNDPLLHLKVEEEVVLFSAVVPENVPVGFVVASLRATDPDKGPGGIVNYDIANEGEAKGLFEVSKSTGDVRTIRALTGKGRTEPYSIIVRASDRGASPLYSDAVLSVLVGDVASNDGVPQFIRPTQSEVARIPENSPIGSPVFKVKASDPDDPNTPNGRIYYRFLDEGKTGSDAMTFSINRDTGLITTRKQVDRERKDRYTLILEASDGGEPPQQASKVLDVIVEDVDDHKPIFKRALYEEPIVFRIREEIEEGTVIGSVAAIDEDIGNNAKIDYRIIYGNEQGLFKISRAENNTGVVSTAGRIDREESSVHNLVIKCFPASESLEYPHKPYNYQDPSEIQVKVIVSDIDDNRPVFVKGNMTVGVRLNVPVDTPVVRLEAKDVDADSGPINFNLTSATFSTLSGLPSPYIIDGQSTNTAPIDVFRLGFEDGELRTAQSLVPYADGVFTLLVTATSISTTPKATAKTNMTVSQLHRQANATLKVFVLRERDLLKFVFSKPPTEVRQTLQEFQQAVEQALLLPSVSLNVYDAQFHSKGDGSLDFGSTSSCFQLVGKESYDLAEMESLLNDPNNAELDKVYKDFGVQDVQRCAPIIARAETSWVQAWVLAIACFIGVASIISTCVLCCPRLRFKKKHHRFGKGGMTPPPPAPPPSILVSTVGLEPDAEWLPGMGPPPPVVTDRHEQFSPYGYHVRR
ncbi:cadherin-23-like [Ischnura elegans]|uniref:cadherin-23-like n=1 Tax=Ischnura elegans TaxID=197161 RepID=UPI001ED8945A|nr:cadherin-23-like [Ischnura elegans]